MPQPSDSKVPRKPRTLRKEPAPHEPGGFKPKPAPAPEPDVPGRYDPIIGEEPDAEPENEPGVELIEGQDPREMSNAEFSAALRNAEKAHPKIPHSSGEQNTLGLRYDHRFDDCHWLCATWKGGCCTAKNFMPCPFLGGNQAKCKGYERFMSMEERPKGPGIPRYAKPPEF